MKSPFPTRDKYNNQNHHNLMTHTWDFQHAQTSKMFGHLQPAAFSCRQVTKARFGSGQLDK